MELANWKPPHLFPSTLTMHPLFTELICTPVRMTAISIFITEENLNAASDTVGILWSLQAISANIYLAKVEEYLQFLTCPQRLSDSGFCKLMQYSSGFFISNGKLWCCNTHGRHKIVVPKEKRYELVKEVHDILGHKKIYIVWMQLL
jgi:hypothetical protein